ncbi:hypothetical protein PG987_010509 [Apiospora arundinis]
MDLQELQQYCESGGEDPINHLRAVTLKVYHDSRLTRNTRLIDLAIAGARRIVQADEGDAARWLVNEGAMFGTRFDMTGKESDLHQAVALFQQAVDSITGDDYDDEDRTGVYNNLSTILQRRYERFGSFEDLEAAIDNMQQALRYLPEESPDSSAVLYSNLSNQLGLRYERTGEMGDLDEAIRVGRKVMELAPIDDPSRGTLIHGLGTRLRTRFRRTGNPNDLTEAVQIARKALEITPKGHQSYPGLQESMANILSFQYGRTENPQNTQDLDEAIRLAGLSIRDTPETHPSYPRRLYNFGKHLHLRYQSTDDPKDLDDAIMQWRLSYFATPYDHPDRASRMYSYGMGLFLRCFLRGEQRDFDEAMMRLADVWGTSTATPFDRVKGGAMCIELLAIEGKHDLAINMGREILDLIPSVNTKLLDRDDQQYVVSTFAGVAANVCSFLLELGQDEDALLCLEQGRTVILNQSMDSRSDVAGLMEAQPEIATRYRSLRDQLNQHMSGHGDISARETERRHRLHLISEFNDCISQIRAIPSHERFLLNHTVTEMRLLAHGGAIVIVNVTRFRSDAVIVLSTGIKAVRLEELTVGDAKEWLSKKWPGKRSERAAKNKEYRDYLEWLWRTCVKPVMEELLALQAPKAEGAFRVWWIGSGLASSMPFHAAEENDPSSNETAYHYAVSSYTPSIKALAHAKKQNEELEKSKGKLLVVTMPTTPAGKRRYGDLANVDGEKRVVLELSKGHISTDCLDKPSVDQVAARLDDCCIAHFACHGSSDLGDPSKSGLILQRQEEVTVQTENGRQPDIQIVQDRLTVGRISEMKLPRARLAYLSACSTAQNQVENLSDEVIHVVSGFQLAGFSHVIGCLWPSIDRVCLEVAGRFYSFLFSQPLGQWEESHVALAIREAVMEVRAENFNLPLYWAQYVHYGV